MPKQITDFPPLIERIKECQRLNGVELGMKLIELSTDPDTEIISNRAYNILLMRFGFGMTNSEIAEELDMRGRNGDIQNAICRAFTALRRHEETKYQGKEKNPSEGV